ncbi:MAG: glycosyltransferase family 4 protein [Deltaproteobacteria bacterium]|nr:glycosyltransferase family 4 protein [Deltaproteobacteria bacterium]
MNNYKIKISLLTGGDDPNYAIPLASSLLSQDIVLDFIGNDGMVGEKIFEQNNAIYLNFRGNQDENAPFVGKVVRILKYYLRLLKYTATTNSQIFHILWHNKFIYFDRTFLILYYKFFGKKIIFTAHNVNEAKRDGTDSLANRLSLYILYKLVDHIIVHTDKMKTQLLEDFKVFEKKITVISFGINPFVPKSSLSYVEAKKKLSLSPKNKAILFFGRIASYKGIEYLLQALAQLIEIDDAYRLIIAGKVNKGYATYWDNMLRIIEMHRLSPFIIPRIEFIPDNDIEIYFKASDVMVLPYTEIFQSGPLFLSYFFGLPVIASDVGSFREDILVGKTGYIFAPKSSEDLRNKIEDYFTTDLYRNLVNTRKNIIKYANKRYSWGKSADTIFNIYKIL